MTDTPRPVEDEVAFLVALAEANVPPDVGELLVHGNPLLRVAPGALRKAIASLRSSDVGLRAIVSDLAREKPGGEIWERSKRFAEYVERAVSVLAIMEMGDG